MENYLYKSIAVNQIQKDRRFSVRWPSVPMPEDLRRSVARRGVLQPGVITQKGELISGHRRFSAAYDAGLKDFPVLELQKTLSDSDLFLTAILLNWNQTWNDWDRVLVLKKARQEFKMSDALLLEEVLPALGLQSKDWILKEYETADGLENEILELGAAGNLPFRGLTSLAPFTKADQKIFAVLVGAQTALTTNQLIQASEWILDLLKEKKLSLEKFLQEPEISQLLGDKEKDKKAKTDLFLRSLRARRFPNVIQKEKQFESLAGRLRQGVPEVTLEVPPYFEAEGLTLRTKVRDPKALEAVLSKIQGHKDLFNSLFDVLL